MTSQRGLENFFLQASFQTGVRGTLTIPVINVPFLRKTSFEITFPTAYFNSLSVTINSTFLSFWVPPQRTNLFLLQFSFFFSFLTVVDLQCYIGFRCIYGHILCQPKFWPIFWMSSQILRGILYYIRFPFLKKTVLEAFGCFSLDCFPSHQGQNCS